MKIRENMKVRKSIKRFVCIALILGMMLTLSSSYVKADSPAEVPVHSIEIAER